MEQELLKRYLNAIFYVAYNFDDKPHKLFSAIAGVATKCDWLEDEERKEIIRLMNRAYERVHECPQLWRGK